MTLLQSAPVERDPIWFPPLSVPKGVSSNLRFGKSRKQIESAPSPVSELRRSQSGCQTGEPEEVTDGHDEIAVSWIAAGIGQLHALARIPDPAALQVRIRIVK